MWKIFQHSSYIILSFLILVAVKSLNPPALDYQIDYFVTIDCINQNLSGISFNPESGNFFVIANSPESIVEISATGVCLNKYPLHGFEDTEDLYYLGEDKFLLVQERQQTVDLMKIDGNNIIHMQSLALNIDTQPNKGLEGVTYNASSNEMFIINEFPQQLLKVSDWQPMSGFKRVETINSIWAKALMTDYSSITDSGEGLLLLSDESSKLLKLDYNGVVQGVLDLQSDKSGSTNLEQAEGIAMDHEENIFVVSEPNMLYVYKKNQLMQAGSLAFKN